MKFAFTGTGVLAAAGVTAAGLALWVLYSRMTGAAGTVGQVLQQGAANVKQALSNATSAPASGGDPVRAALYGQAGYTGQDVTGQTPETGEFYSRPDLRAYAHEYSTGARAEGLPEPVTTNSGAVFGVYPSSGRRQPPTRPRSGFADVVPDTGAEVADETMRLLGRYPRPSRQAPLPPEPDTTWPDPVDTPYA